MTRLKPILTYVFFVGVLRYYLKKNLIAITANVFIFDKRIHSLSLFSGVLSEKERKKAFTK